MKIALIVPPLDQTTHFADTARHESIGDLARALDKCGHEATVINLPTTHSNARPIERLRTFLTTILKYNFDVIHDHTGRFCEIARNRRTPPILSTDHGSKSNTRFGLNLRKCSRCTTISISDFQERSYPFRTQVIHPGVDTERLAPSEATNGFLVLVDRSSHVLGAQLALRAISSLDVFGQVVIRNLDSRSHAVLVDEIRSLGATSVRVYPNVSLEQRSELLQHATALISPITRAQSFSLATTEAFSCGTPVIGFRIGSASEVVEHGVTGLLGKYFPNREQENVATLCSLIKSVKEIDRWSCRNAAIDYFNCDRMAADYVAAYLATIRQQRPTVDVRESVDLSHSGSDQQTPQDSC